MFKYRSIIENPEKLRSMTGLTVEEFHALVPIFHVAFEAYMKRRTIDGRVRYCRRYLSYANSPLPTTEDKLLFILTLLKTESDASDARTYLPHEPIKQKHIGASFAWSAERCAIAAESPLDLFTRHHQDLVIYYFCTI